MENQAEKKWYQKPVTVVLLLIFFFPVGLYLMWKHEVWSKTARWIISAVFALAVIANAGNGSAINTGNDFELKISKEYYFFDKYDDLDCYECDKCWRIEFLNETNANLFSKQCNSTSPRQSCKSMVSYKFDKNTKTVTILSVTNSNVSAGCRNRFVGEWLWSDGEFGERFYSKNIPGTDFH